MASKKKSKSKTSEPLVSADTVPAPEITGKAVEETAEKPADGFPVVGIGASAGGLSAFEAFFSGMSKDMEQCMAFVLVQHLAPDHKSILAELIGRYTKMKVLEVEDGMKVQVNCVYIIPPNHDMALLNGALQLLKPVCPRGQRLPVDFFFRSLAQDKREQSIGIVLSGTGGDGTLGVRAIKGEGGMVMVQSPASTEFDGMPCSAIATGLVDYELPPSEMPAKLMAYVAHAFQNRPRISATAILEPKTESALKRIFVLLRSQTGHDFSQYKPSTIYRRIGRRMSLQQTDRIDDYFKYMQRNPAEVILLFHELLIGVTSFFRDPDAFKVLEEKGVSKLFEDKPAGSAIRVWSTGCSTGEEAYSLAILLQERLDVLKQGHSLQIFATDIDSRAIAIARAGLYPASIAADITPERLQHFFVPEPNGGLRLHKRIRDQLVFSEHDLLRDPPFSKIDLLCCRNLLIYLNADLQKRLIPLFHYSLNPGGMLFLGTSETVGEFGDMFAAMDRKAKLYQRKDGARSPYVDRIIPVYPKPDEVHPKFAEKTVPPVKHSPRELAERAMLKQIFQAGALVNGKGDIIYIHGRTGLYLELAPGDAGVNNILKTAREGLKHELTLALHRAVQDKETVCRLGLRVKTNGDFSGVNLTVSPVVSDPSAMPDDVLYLVILEEAGQPPAPSILPKLAEGGDDAATASIVELNKELLAKEEYLQSSLEELESSTEELKSSNEEMQSMNEELQSTNEELETSKEELQSVNEELFTVNNELQIKVVDLSRANNDINNLLAGTGIGTLFVNHELLIMRFTPPITNIINIIQSDVGRSLHDFTSLLKDYRNLEEDILAVLKNLIPIVREVQTMKDRWYLMRILPYRTTANVIEGAVISFVDIMELKKLHVDIEAMKKVEDALRKSEERLNFALQKSHIGAWELDLRDHTSRRTLIHDRIFGYETLLPNWTYEMFLNHVLPEDRPDVDRSFREATKAQADWNFECRIRRPDGELRWIWVAGGHEQTSGGKSERMSGIVIDITERKKSEEALREANSLARLAVVLRDAHDSIQVHDLEGRIIAWNPGAERIYGWSEAEGLKMNIRDLIPEDRREEALDKMRLLCQYSVLEPYRTQRITKDGRTVDVHLTATALLDKTGKIYAIATTEREMGEVRKF